ncbi:MAG TPA: glycosyltransferase family 4 protein [Terriglobia bacterium]|nr:glycosyltransferase family 4 protein [Terriglobia bacterium]
MNLSSRLARKKGSCESLHRSFNVLVIDEWPPLPANSGRTIRTWGLLERLARRHKISMLCYSDPDTEPCKLMRAAEITVHAVPPFREHRGIALYCDLLANTLSRFPYSVWKHFTPRFHEQLRNLLKREQFDVVHCECTPYARFLDAAVKTPRLVMAHNIESQILLRRAQTSHSMTERVFFNLQARKMEAFERRVFAEADWVTTVSQLDADCARAWGARQVSLVENGVDQEYFAPTRNLSSENGILFLASLDWYPNLDALDYLLEEILPLIEREKPGIKLRIVGRRPSAVMRERIAGRSNVELVGEVADVRPFLSQAGVVVVPLRIGGGSRIKIIEALSMAKAVVSTSIGAEGLEVRDGEHLLIADSPSDFARRTIEALASPELRLCLGEKGRKLAVERYSWDRMALALEWAWEQVSGVKNFSEPMASPVGAQGESST